MKRLSESQLLILFGVMPGLLVAIGALLVVPVFQETFVNAGVHLPLETRILLATFRWWRIVVLVTLGLWLRWPVRSRRGIVALAFGAVSAILLFQFGIWALYAPIFQLAAGKG